MGVRTFQVDVPAPYRLDLTVWTLRRRAHNEIDRWDGSSYQRTLMVAGRSIEATVCQ
jgi:DNA-3-methyladenine glycosylase II